MADLIESLESEFQKWSNPKIASGQKAYLRNHFDFYGISTTVRREIQKRFLMTDFLPPKGEIDKIVKVLWQKPQREFQYFAQELAYKYIKQPEQKDIVLYEFMVTNKSWWDTVDFIANKLMGDYFKSFPDQTHRYVKNWLESGNIWLQRSALLFQLKYKKDLDKDLLCSTINSLSDSKEFFINKAIGWVLREYSRTNPEWVKDFVKATQLNALSKREALKLI